MKKKTFYITTPIYYASGPLHIGHLYCTIMAWTIANYKKIKNYDVKFLTGSDEHGQKIQNKAAKANLAPHEFVNNLVKQYKQTWKDWHIDYDYFSRTTDKKHEALIQKIFSWYLSNDFIYKGKYEGLYSVEDEEFLARNQAINKDGKFYHPSSGHELVLMKEDSYFFQLSKMQNWWLDYVKKHPNFLKPRKIVNEMINNFISEGLEDLSVTRNNVSWAIPIAEDSNHTLYVWLDALFNYVSALGFDLKNPGADYLKYWEEGDEIVHILGKEIARFHFIYWPIFLKSLNLKLPNHIISHGLLRDDQGRKMSKSLNNVIAPEYLLSKYHHEMIKYYFASQVIFGEDANFSESKLVEVINADLVNNYGNLVSRTLKMISNSFKKPLIYKPSSKKEYVEIDNAIISFENEFSKLMDEFKIDKAYHYAIELSSKLNKFIDMTLPWTLSDDLPNLEQILVRLLNGIYAVSWALQISMPEKVSEVAVALKINKFEIEKIPNLNKFDKIIPIEKYMFFKRIKQ